MGQARRQRRELKRLIDKLQAKQNTKYKFEEVFKDIMDKEIKYKSGIDPYKALVNKDSICEVIKLNKNEISDTSN